MSARSLRLPGLAAQGALLALLLQGPLLSQAAAPLGPYPGPSRRAALVENTRHALRFDASLDGAEARAYVDQGFAMLHGGGWFEAERSFRQAAALQPSGAIAHLGAAMAAEADPFRARYFVESALAWRERASEREQLLIDAWAERYEVSTEDAQRARAKKARNAHEPRRVAFDEPEPARAERLRRRLEVLVAQHPEGVELRALLLQQLHLQLRSETLQATARDTAREAAAKLFDALPGRHPGRLHFLDHAAFDDADRGLAALRDAAPFSLTPVTTHGTAGRMLLRLRRAADALPHLEAAVHAGFGYLAREWTMPFLVDGFVDAAVGRAQALARLGRVQDALEWHRQVQRLPRHPTLNSLRDAESLASRHLTQLAGLCIEFDLPGVAEAALADGWAEPILDDGLSVPARGILTQAVRLGKFAVGHREGRIATLRQDLAARPDELSSRAELLLFLDGTEPEFANDLQALREAAGHADRDLEVFAGVRAHAARQGLPSDWRLPRDPLLDWPRDLGPRPIPEDLGPDRWAPPHPPDWAFRNADGKTVRAADYRGHPLVQIAYLGFGCQHCIDALNTFEPELHRLYSQDIDFVAIGTDSLKGLRSSLGALNPRDLPAYPMLADRKLRVFREWLAFDEFEHVALHGTWLLDSTGRVLWVETGYQPFEEPVWLSKEARRLLSSSSPR